MRQGRLVLRDSNGKAGHLTRNVRMVRFLLHGMKVRPLGNPVVPEEYTRQAVWFASVSGFVIAVHSRLWRKLQICDPSLFLSLTSGCDSRTRMQLRGRPASEAALRATDSSSLLHANTCAGPS